MLLAFRPRSAQRKTTVEVYGVCTRRGGRRFGRLRGCSSQSKRHQWQRSNLPSRSVLWQCHWKWNSRYVDFLETYIRLAFCINFPHKILFWSNFALALSFVFLYELIYALIGWASKASYDKKNFCLCVAVVLTKRLNQFLTICTQFFLLPNLGWVR